jgi:hypothetical protein
MIHVTGHTMVGVGYDDATNLMYIHDTWDYNTYTMTWGGSYAGMDHYGVTIVHLGDENIVLDFGDLDGLPSFLSENGPRHATADLWLGDSYDQESDSRGYENDNPTDDGVVFLGSGPIGGPYSLPYSGLDDEGAIEVTVNGNYSHAYVSAWYDQNNNVSFDDPSDNIVNDALVNVAGTYTFTFPMDPAAGGDAPFRIRVSPTPLGTSGYVDYIYDGEVEDYMILAPVATAPVTFQADLTNFIAAGWFDPGNAADSIVVNGSFNGWNSNEKMTPDPGNANIYQYTVDITMTPGEFIQWKFKLFPPEKWQNGGWEFGDNRLTEFTGEEIILDPSEPNVAPIQQHFIPVDPTGRIQPVYIVDATLDDVQLEPGDEVAVLDGDLVVGAAVIEELPMINPISVYLTYTPPGGDPLPGAQDGNEMSFRVWDQSAAREECANILEVITGEPVFAEGAIVALSLEAPCEITQTIGIIPSFLNLISFNVHPLDNSAIAVFDPLPNFIIAQDDDGNVRIPPDIVFPGHPGTNTIDDNGGIKVEKGYNVFIGGDTEQILEVTGLAVDLTEMAIPIAPAKLNKIAFPSQAPMLIGDVFNSIVNMHVYNDLSIVQDHDGYVYIPPNVVFPGHPGSNTIDPNGGLQPGKGYMLYHRHAEELSFYYPEAGGGAALAKAGANIEKEIPLHYTCLKTGAPHALFLKNLNVQLAEGDEFGVFAEGKCVGSNKYVDNLDDPLIIWQAVPDYDLSGIKDGDILEIRLWRQKSETIEILELDGDVIFSRERVFSLVKISSGMKSDGLNLVSDIIPKEMGLRQNYPNPFNPTTTIEISLNKDADVSLVIYNIRGEVVRRLISGYYPAGKYTVQWDSRNEHGQKVASGIYIYSMQAGAFVENRKMIFSK